MNGVADTDPYIKEAEAGDEAADGSVEQDCGEVRKEEHVAFVGPDVGPRERDDEHAEIDTNNDTHG